MVNENSLKERILNQCAKVAMFFNARENARLRDKMDDVAIYDGHADFEITQLRKLMDEMDGNL